MSKSIEWNCKYCKNEFKLPNIDTITNERHCPNCYSIKIKKINLRYKI